MKHATLALRQSRADRHPMHQFVVDRNGYEATRLLASTVTGAHHAAVFHVSGWPPDPYRAALGDVETVTGFEVAEQSDETFSVYVREAMGGHDRELVEGLDREGLVVWLPVVYRADGAVVLTLVGPAATLQSAVEAVPDAVTVDVRDVGAFDARRVGTLRDLTDRQSAAVTAAVDLGYYEEPRSASVADVADAIGCSPSTAAEHLRRAERTLMGAYVRGRHGRAQP